MNKYALIVGGTSGLGLALTKEYSKLNYSVISIGRKFKEEHNLIKNTKFVYVDLLNNNINFDMLSDLIPNNKLNLIIYNIGGSLNIKDVKSDEHDYNEVMKINLYISLNITKLLYSKFDNSDSKIIYILSASINSYEGYTPYVVAKGAVLHYIKSACKIFIKEGISICAVSPTSMNYENRYYTKIFKNKNKNEEWIKLTENKFPLGRLLKIVEVKNAVLFLSNKRNGYVNGTIINLDGGSTC
jgi:NAD(P)-dependent dehydrogenase (short-subunit alcohol dehydrogenase family)